MVLTPSTSRGAARAGGEASPPWGRAAGSPVFSVLKKIAHRMRRSTHWSIRTPATCWRDPGHRRAPRHRPRVKRQGLARQARPELDLLKQLQARRYQILVHLTDHCARGWLARRCDRDGRWRPCAIAGSGSGASPTAFLPQHTPRHTVEANRMRCAGRHLSRGGEKVW